MGKGRRKGQNNEALAQEILNSMMDSGPSTTEEMRESMMMEVAQRPRPAYDD
eukprot:gene13840-4051_t